MTTARRAIINPAVAGPPEPELLPTTLITSGTDGSYYESDAAYGDRLPDGRLAWCAANEKNAGDYNFEMRILNADFSLQHGPIRVHTNNTRTWARGVGVGSDFIVFACYQDSGHSELYSYDFDMNLIARKREARPSLQFDYRCPFTDPNAPGDRVFIATHDHIAWVDRDLNFYNERQLRIFEDGSEKSSMLITGVYLGDPTYLYLDCMHYSSTTASQGVYKVRRSDMAYMAGDGYYSGGNGNGGILGWFNGELIHVLSTRPPGNEGVYIIRRDPADCSIIASQYGGWWNWDTPIHGFFDFEGTPILVYMDTDQALTFMSLNTSLDTIQDWCQWNDGGNYQRGQYNNATMFGKNIMAGYYGVNDNFSGSWSSELMLMDGDIANMLGKGFSCNTSLYNYVPNPQSFTSQAPNLYPNSLNLNAPVSSWGSNTQTLQSITLSLSDCEMS